MIVPAKMYKVSNEMCNLQIIRYGDHIDVRSDFLGEYETVLTVSTPSPNCNCNSDQIKWATYIELIKHLPAEEIRYDIIVPCWKRVI